jgi:phage regulator Rha-like protein
MNLQIIHNKIFEIRGQRVMLDYDIAELYEVETKRINEQVKRNKARFPQDFMFRLSPMEWEIMRSQIATASIESKMQSQNATASQNKRNSKVTPYAFAEHGVTMLASVLKSTRAINMNIAIVRAFVALKQITNKYQDFSIQIDELRQELKARIGEHDIQLSSIYDALENLLDKKEEESQAKEKWEKRQRIGFKK